MTEEITFVRACDKIPWGFRLTGGVDFSCPLTVSRITGNSIAEKRGLKVGDIITEIGNEKAVHLTHADAQHLIIGAKNSLRLAVLRGSCPDVTRALTPVRGLTPLLPVNIEKKKTVSTTSVNSVNSLFDDDSFEFLGQSDDDLLEEKREPTEEQIEQMLLENAEVIEEKGKTTIGVNFHRFIPKCDFIKDSAVFQILQDEQVHKELSEKEQLQKYPNKRFSTFLLPPDRPVLNSENKVMKEKKNMQKNNVKENVCSLREMTRENNKSFICDTCIKPEYCVCKNESKLKIEANKYTTIMEEDYSQSTNQLDQLQVDVESKSFVEQKSDTLEHDRVASTSAEVIPSDCKQLQISEIRKDELQNTARDENDYDKQLKDIKNTLNVLGHLPVIIQSQLNTIQAQLNNLSKVKETEFYVDMSETNQIDVLNEDSDSPIQPSLEENEMWEVEQKKETQENENEDTQPEHEHKCQENENEGNLSHELHEMNEKTFICEQSKNENFEEQDFERRHACPLTPLPRPMVLPGGRIWRKPKDAYNEEFIAETLISQAEVLVGSTLGVNFRKYETPKIDYSNSAVYKLVHDLDSKKCGLADRDVIPALQDYYQSPISARHFYCASLAEKARLANQHKNVEKN